MNAVLGRFARVLALLGAGWTVIVTLMVAYGQLAPDLRDVERGQMTLSHALRSHQGFMPFAAMFLLVALLVALTAMRRTHGSLHGTLWLGASFLLGAFLYPLQSVIGVFLFPAAIALALGGLLALGLSAAVRQAPV